MAKNTQPVLKRCKTLGLSPAVLGYSKETKRNPKAHVRRKQSEYGRQLNEKQKVKFIYGVLEKQFHSYYEKAERKKGITGEIMLQELERRLDNVVFRMGLACRPAARPVSWSTTATSPSTARGATSPPRRSRWATLSPCAKRAAPRPSSRALIEEYGKKATPQWIEREPESFEAKIVALPAREDIDYEVSENLIVELYSR